MSLSKKSQNNAKEQPLSEVARPSKKSQKNTATESSKKLPIPQESTKKKPKKQGDSDAPESDLTKRSRSSMKLLIPQQKNVDTEILVKSRKKYPTESCVVELFGRTLDLSKFNESTPLYSMCRTWMSNQPRNTTRAACNKEADNATGQQQREDNAEEVLAQLKSGMLEMLTQLPQARSTNLTVVPPALVYTELEKMQEEMLQGAPVGQLLAANVARWKRIRNHWQEHARTYNHERYELFDQIMNVAMKKKDKE